MPLKIIFKFALVIFCLGFSNISHAETDQRYEYEGTPYVLEDLHVDTAIDYSTTPFNSFIQDAFNNNTHTVNILEIGDDALLARVHFIRQAKKSIYVQTFIWDDDESGRKMMYELVEAAKRGVRVKIIVDQLAANRDPQLVAAVSKIPNLDVKFYNPIVKKVRASKLNLLRGIFNLKKLNQRMHNKIVVVDDRIGITGGRNYQNDYFDRSSTRNFMDRDVLVIGPEVKKMTKSFMEYWSFPLSIDSEDMIDVRRNIESGNILERKTKGDWQMGEMFNELDQCSVSKECIKKHFLNDILKADSVQFIADSPGKNTMKGLAGGGKTTVEIAKILREAKESIIFQTPYLVLDGKMRRYFMKKRREKPDLEMLVSSNSLASADHFYAYAFSYKHKKYYLKNLKWRIFEFKLHPEDLDEFVPPLKGIKRSDNYMTTIHSKSFTIDDNIAFIGSFNLDPRSAHLNTEAGFIFRDKEVTAKLKQYVLWNMATQNSWTIAKRRHVPFISRVNSLVATISKLIPVIDMWPFEYSESFQLMEGYEEMPFYEEGFYERYQAAGPFPDVPYSAKQMKTRLIKAFFGPAEVFI